MILGIYGSGGSGREVKEMADILGCWEEIVFIDDTVEVGVFKGIKRMPFEMFCKTYSREKTEVVVALGEPKYKIILYDKVKKSGFPLTNIVHPTSWISPTAKIGEGVIVKARVLISCDTVMRDNVGIEPFVSIGHDCIIGENCQISSGVMIGGNTTIGAGTYIGINVSIREKIVIGSNSVVGMGAVVQRDIPDNVIALGNPARAMKHKDDKNVFAK